MKKPVSLQMYYFIALCSSLLLSGLIVLCFSRFAESMFAFLPIPFCAWTFLSFFYPKDVQKHVAGLFLTIVSRFLCSVASLLIPALIWKFVPSYSSVSYYWLFFPFAEIMLTYALFITCNIVEKKKGDTK